MDKISVVIVTDDDKTHTHEILVTEDGISELMDNMREYLNDPFVNQVFLIKGKVR